MVKMIMRLVEDQYKNSDSSIENTIPMISDEGLKRLEKMLRSIVEQYESSSIFYSDAEKHIFTYLYNKIVLAGGDRELWEVQGYAYQEDADELASLVKDMDQISPDALKGLYRIMQPGCNESRRIIADYAQTILRNKEEEK